MYHYWLRRKAKYAVGLACSVFVFAYFFFHFFQGDRGLSNYISLDKQVSEAKQTLAQITEKRQGLEHRVSRMRSENLDTEILDERVRAVFGYGRPDEFELAQEHDIVE